MFLTIPTTLSEPGPDYANDVNTSTALIDLHDHTTGKGVKVPTAGLTINADLPVASNNIYQIRGSKFDNQSGALTQPTDLRMLYVRNGELYFIDNIGNQVKMTNAGFVNVTGSSGIGGDYPAGGAALNYTLATLTYELLSNTSGPAYANMNVGGVNFRSFITAVSTAVASSPYTVAASDVILLVDTSSARTINLPNAATSKRLLVIKDATGSAATNNITVDRSAGGNIDGVASNKTLKNAFGIWYFLSDGANWFLIKTEVPDLTSYTVFEGSSAVGSDTIPTAFASPTLSAAAFFEGTAVTRSTNTLTFPSIGKYECEFFFGELTKTGGTTGDLLVRVRNTTDSTTAGVSTNAQVTTAISGLTSSVKVPFNVPDIAKNYEVQWATSNSTVTTSNVTVNGETGPRWRFILRKLKDT